MQPLLLSFAYRFHGISLHEHQVRGWISTFAKNNSAVNGMYKEKEGGKCEI